MKLHPRQRIVAEAKIELSAAVSALIRTHDLTYTELFIVLNESQRDWLRFALRDERHPGEPDRKADEA